VTALRKKKKPLWTSRAAQRFIELAHDARSVEEAVANLAQAQLQGAEGPPTNLDFVAAKLGITGFEAADLSGSGELRKDGDALRIFYSPHLSLERRRFTIAHELAHALLEKTGGQAPRYGKELERLCDMFAVELLMPEQEFIHHAEGALSTQRIVELAKTFRTSITATAFRYAQLGRVSVFGSENARVLWGKGIIRPDRSRMLDSSLQPAVRRAIGGEICSDEVILSSINSWNVWHIDCRPLEWGKTALCLLRPAERRPVWSSIDVTNDRR
jgi:hypothetical protein